MAKKKITIEVSAAGDDDIYVDVNGWSYLVINEMLKDALYRELYPEDKKIKGTRLTHTRK